MASGETLLTFEATDYFPPPPGWIFATPDMRNAQPVLDFKPGEPPAAMFAGRMPRHYAGGGITCSLMWTATAGEGTLSWAVYLERHDPSTDLDFNSFGTGGGGTLVASSPLHGAPIYTEVVLAPSQLDGVLPGEHFRLLIARNAGGTLASDAELWSVELRET